MIHGTVCNSLREVEHYIHKNGDIVEQNFCHYTYWELYGKEFVFAKHSLEKITLGEQGGH